MGAAITHEHAEIWRKGDAGTSQESQRGRVESRCTEEARKPSERTGERRTKATASTPEASHSSSSEMSSVGLVHRPGCVSSWVLITKALFM